MKVRMKTVVMFYWGLDTWARTEEPAEFCKRSSRELGTGGRGRR